MLQQTQVKTVIPFWNRWLRELPTIEAAAKAPSAKIHKLWEGLGYYTRVRNLQKAAHVIAANHGGTFPKDFDDILTLPGIGRYTAGAISSIAFNQAVPILDGNVIRVLTRLYGIAEDPKERGTNARLWQLAEELVKHSSLATPHSSLNCSHLNQSLMELGALVCTPRNAQCLICPLKKLCVAFKENRTEELPNLGKRDAATARRFFAFVVEHNGRFLVQQRPSGVVNAHLWEFPNVEVGARHCEPQHVIGEFYKLRITAPRSEKLTPLCIIKHSITRYRITLEAFFVHLGGTSSTSPHSKSKPGTRGARPSKKLSTAGVWLSPKDFDSIAFSSAHKKLASAAAKSILSGR